VSGETSTGPTGPTGAATPEIRTAPASADSQVLAAGKYLTLIDEHGWEYVTRPGITGVVVIVAITDDEKVLLVEQYRTAVHRRVIELPAGLVGDGDTHAGESLRDAAARELAEETGFAARELEPLAQGPIAVGISDEMISFFGARGLTRVGPGGGDATESITVHQVPLGRLRATLATYAAEGLAVDPKIYAGLFLVDAAVRT
jgi:ADP-ribose pyrophosphatase